MRGPDWETTGSFWSLLKGQYQKTAVSMNSVTEHIHQETHAVAPRSPARPRASVQDSDAGLQRPKSTNTCSKGTIWKCEIVAHSGNDRVGGGPA